MDAELLKRMVPLRRRLFLVAIAALVPLGVIAALGLVELVSRQREDSQRAGIELTRALATAVDAELGRSISVLHAVVWASVLDLDDLRQFHARAMRVVRSQPYWRAIVLAELDGTPVLHTGFSYGARLPPLAVPADVARVRETAAPVIANLAASGAGEIDGAELSFSVCVPVRAGLELRYVAIAVIDPGAIVEILRRQRVPSDWVISIFDRAGQRVARSRTHEENLGKPGSASVVALMAQPEDEGWGRTIAVEGQPIYTAYSRVKGAGWTVATGIPLGVVDGAAWNTALTLGAGWLISIGIGIAAALLVARSIAGPIATLRRAAEALGHRQPFAAPTTGIVEVRRVGEALAAAADELDRGELERERLLALEHSAREAAEAANRAKDEFLAMLGHELRNPLGAVSNAVALLQRPDVSPDVTAAAREIIARQTAHLARLTDDLLDAARAITGKIVLSQQRLDLAAQVERALAAFDVRGRRLVRDLHPVWVNGDPTRIDQIVVNLVQNAVKYTESGGTIEVSVRPEADRAVLRVRDDGAGMSRDLVARVFDLFVQGDHGLDRAAGGLGIGLTLVHRLAELHGGRAEAESDGPGKGSTLTVRLPSIAPDVAAAADARSEPRVAPARDVLLIEDNDDARVALVKLLELGGHRVRAVSNGANGLASALGAPPEIVLVDIGLPGLDGYEVARRLRSAHPQILLVAVTGYGLDEDRERALAAGFDVHLVKPIDLDLLSAVLAG